MGDIYLVWHTQMKCKYHLQKKNHFHYQHLSWHGLNADIYCTIVWLTHFLVEALLKEMPTLIMKSDDMRVNEISSCGNFNAIRGRILRYLNWLRIYDGKKCCSSHKIFTTMICFLSLSYKKLSTLKNKLKSWAEWKICSQKLPLGEFEHRMICSYKHEMFE